MANQLEDREIVKRITNGEDPVFAVLIRSTEGLVAQIMFKMVPNAEDRKDLAQDVYLKVYRHIRDFRCHCKLSTWVASIAYNTCYNYLEKKKLILPDNLSTAENPGNDLLEKMANRFIDFSTNESLANLFRSELADVLEQAISRLPQVYATLITLFHYQELSYEEIMEITGLPEGTLKNYLFRARKALKTYILLNYKQEDL
ncbi:RNA polymerase sigma factor [Pedobacter sp. ASV28]|uniref:RNA polymerase sigma factor n=1 Tax=Pedobacter sp. ASV28 TaxID=2795123 RepID=UPI0018EAD30E|nr:sigma-70 family RNA polymerase sigma factor [Pedobacter sp. ASV28]